MQGFSVREIADRVRRPHEDMGTVVDRIRGWSDVGLIGVLGSKFPGTGSRRQYGPEAIIDAVILTALTDAGLAAVRVGHFVSDDGQTVLSFGRLGACEVLDPRKKGRPTFLVICGPAPSPVTVFLSYGETKLNQLPPGAPWSIILNLTEYFRPLRGIVTAVLERGSVKIELLSERD
jgi:hypothetical protein